MVNISEKDAADKIATEVNAEFIGEFENKILSDCKVEMNPEYLHNIKVKVEKILLKIIGHYELQDCISEKYRFRLDEEKLYSSKYHTYFEKKQDITGKQLKYGYIHIAETFTEWLDIYLNDYCQTEVIYTLMCNSRRIRKEDLIYLNKMANKYKVT